MTRMWQRRVALTSIHVNRVQRCQGLTRVWALHSKGTDGKKKRKKREKALESERVLEEGNELGKEIQDVVVEEEGSPQERQVYQSVETTPALWKRILQHESFGWAAFGSVIAALTGYLIYLVVSKDRTETINQIEYDLNQIITQLRRLKEIRMEPDLLESDVIRVRSFLISLIIKQKKQDPVKVINSTLSLLNERHLNDSEKKMLGIDQTVKPQLPLDSSSSLSELGSLTMMDSITTSDVNEQSHAFDPDATVLWWHKLSYICILQMKKSGALFMTRASRKGPDEFAIVGFEDPEEAFHAGKMPVHQQLWGVLSAMKRDGTMPDRPLEDEKHFDLTWLQPKEFNDLMKSAGCYGVVVPAGTLRSLQTARPIPIRQIKSAIDKVCDSEKIGATEAQHFVQNEALADAAAFQETSEGMDREEVDAFAESEVDADDLYLLGNDTEMAGERFSVDDLSLGDDLLNELPSESGGASSTDKQVQMNGFHSNAVAGELLKSRPLEDLSTSIDIEPSDTTSGTDASSTSSASSIPWWMELETVVVPKIKTPGNHGGNVEINISINPEVTDFRPVLFEDLKEARYFLGILGQLHGPNTLVATLEQSPATFMAQNSKIKKEKVVTLCTGALLLDRDADRGGVRNAVRLAHVATEIKKGVHTPPGEGDDADLSDRAKKVAQTVISNFKDRMDNNLRTNSKEGDSEYQDPIEGLMEDLDRGGLDDLFSSYEDGISAEVGAAPRDLLSRHFGVQSNGNQGDFYKQFVDRMTSSINRTQQDISTPITDTELHANGAANKEDIDLEASLDDLIRDETLTEQTNSGEAEDVDVVFPDIVDSERSSNRSSRWFTELNVIFMPQYLTSRGRTMYLAMTEPNSGKRIVIGFEGREDALACKELMKTWSTGETVASGIAATDPQSLLSFCEEFKIEPVIVRTSSLYITMDMSESEFLGRIAMIADVQATDFPIPNA